MTRLARGRTSERTPGQTSQYWVTARLLLLLFVFLLLLLFTRLLQTSPEGLHRSHLGRELELETQSKRSFPVGGIPGDGWPYLENLFPRSLRQTGEEVEEESLVHVLTHLVQHKPAAREGN